MSDKTYYKCEPKLTGYDEESSDQTSQIMKEDKYEIEEVKDEKISKD